MVFWILITAIALATAGILIGASLRGRSADAQDFDIQVYRDQLAEVDRDVARGVLGAEDADRVRTEISRRILASDAQGAAAQGDAGMGRVALMALSTLLLVGGGIWTYMQLGAPGYGDLALSDRIALAQQARETRPSQAQAEAGIRPDQRPLVAEQTPEYLALVAQLRDVVAQRPNDTRGWRLLAVSEGNLGNYTAAHQAFTRYLDLRGANASAEEFADLADMLILAAGGYVSPEAESALARALQMSPGNGPARYYWGLMELQTGRPDQAFRIWDALLRAGPAEAQWIPPIQAQIDEVALRAGVQYAQPLPGGGRGPSAEDIEAAGEMSASDRMEMIQGMVAGLSDRLATDGGTYQEWAQLITALGVLGRTQDALSVYRNSQEVFADNETALDHLRRAGDQAGVAN